MTEHKINNLNNFIMGWYQDDNSILDEIIEFQKSADKVSGRISNSDGVPEIQKDFKNSLDCFLKPNTDLFNKYSSQYLQNCTNEYIKRYPYCNMYNPWTIICDINIQYYPPGGGFPKWHTERFSDRSPITASHLVFMTYLNDVTDCGETEFFHQKIKIKPEKGLTLIWPADWTFTHRGIVSPTQEKSIITGWYHYYTETPENS
jgi:hypothetical protein